MPQTADQDRHALLARLGAVLSRGRGHALAALGVRLSAAGLAYLLQILLARVLGPADFGTYNIRVNAIAPGWIMTERQIDLWLTPEGEKELMERQCLKRKLYRL